MAGVSFANLLYRPIFNRLGVPAVLTLANTVYDKMPNGTPLLALDKTIGVSLPQQGGTVVETVTPMAEFMMVDLVAIGVTKDQLDDGSIRLNGKTWSIVSHKTNPSHSGEMDGTIFLQLEGAADD